MARRATSSRYLLCVANDGYLASLEVRKVYRRLPDTGAMKHRLVRVIDESGEDYLFPEKLFVPVELPAKARKAFVPAR